MQSDGHLPYSSLLLCLTLPSILPRHHLHYTSAPPPYLTIPTTPLPYLTFTSPSPSPPLLCPTLPLLLLYRLTSPHLALTSIIAGQVDLSGQTHCCGQSNASRGEGRALHWHHSLPASIRYVCLRLTFILYLLTILWLLKLLLHLFKMIAVIRNILFIS